MRRSTIFWFITFLVVSLGSLGATLAAGNSPNLGLDLQGGASVVLRPAESVSDEVLDQSIEIIRSRVDALGVAEPDISRQGDTIIVQLPGVKDQQRALAIVGQTAELRFRPVLEVLPPEGETPASTTTTTAPTTETTAAPTETTAPATTAPAGETTTTTAAPDPAAAGAGIETTLPEENKADAEVVLPECEPGVRSCIGANADKQRLRYRLGPAELTGRAVKTARAAIPQGQWVVDFELTSEGSKGFDEMAAKNLQRQVAIELDGIVESAPTIQTDNFGGQGQISGDFSEREAKDLALVLRYGSLPVQLKQDTVQTVSATLGRDSLNAGLVAGLGGLLLVLLYMILYYRALGLVVVVGLGLTGALMWSVVSLLGETSGLALSLAGATGLIVSVGVTVDSYVVYFERLRDEIRAGKSVRSSVDRGFTRAFRTIFAANFVSFIGAALLYILTVGPVRGFAFFLGLSTVFDVIVAFFFTRPMVILLGRSRLFTEAPFFGVARGLAVRGDDDPADRKRGIFFRLYYGETNYQVVSRRRLWFALSAAVIVLGMGSVVARGLNFGIDFEGGTAWEVNAPGVSVAEARDALRPAGLADAKVQVLGDDRLRVQADLDGEENAERREEVSGILSDLAGGEEVAINEVGPSWGTQITEKAQRALIFFFLAIALYISFRFEWKMAVAALAAVVHDILVTVGIYSLFGFEISPATVISVLTILGFSLYDTIVVFDKVDENTKGLAASGRMTYADTANLSMNQVLMRSLNTSVVAILPVLSVLIVGSYILGATTLQDFGLALAIGLVTGAYSSIYIATPLLAILKEREPRYRAIRDRLASRAGAGGGGLLTPAAAAAGGLTPSLGGDTEGGGRPVPRPPTRTGQPPRGRKKKRR